MIRTLGVPAVETISALRSLVGEGKIEEREETRIPDIRRYNEVMREIFETERILEEQRAIRFVSVATRYFIITLEDKLRKLEAERGALISVIRTYKLVPEFIHWTVVGNMDTKDQYTTLVASCTLDYDVLKPLEDDYYKRAVVKVDDWMSDMFNQREVKYSSETSATSKETADELLERGDKVTIIAYYWWWDRTGRTSNKEDLEGYITWDDPIPLGVSGGWFTTGRRRRK